MFKVREDDLSGEATRQLLTLHLAGMHANSPPDSVYALDLSGLKAPGVTVWSVWEGDEVIGIGALKELGNGSGEVKSMRTHPYHLRRGRGCAAAGSHCGRGQGAGIDPFKPRDRNRPGVRSGAGALPEAWSLMERRSATTSGAPSTSSSTCNSPLRSEAEIETETTVSCRKIGATARRRTSRSKPVPAELKGTRWESITDDR